MSSFGCSSEDYSEVKIGDQIWMGENLNVENYRNGDSIPQVNDKVIWGNLKSGAWCYYNNDQSNGEKYGKLYNWYAVNDPRGLAPEGWHIPNNAEFESLMIATDDNGNSLKAVGQGSGIGTGSNSSGFSALLAGGRDNYSNGDFFNLDTAYFWSSSQNSPGWADIFMISGNDNNCNLAITEMKYGFSVRCVKD